MRDLKFIHITKTAGTSIEQAGINAGLSWGWRHREYGRWHECFPLKPHWLREKHDWFAVVRNPYDRIVSEFHCRFAMDEDAEQLRWSREAMEKGDVDMFNRLIRHRIRTRDTNGGHYTEQFRYFESATPVRVLRFESLAEEFHVLMDQYLLGVRMNVEMNKGVKAFGVDHIGEKTLRLVNHVYEKDFQLFGYDMRKTKPIFQ